LHTNYKNFSKMTKLG